MRILVADDSTVSRKLLEQTVRGWGYDVVSARDGLEAFRLLSEPDPPQLAILDWMMPGLTGPEICKNIRAAGKEPYIYTLLLTSRAEREDVVEGMKAGADDYIKKPFDRHELDVRLRAGRRIVDLQMQLLSTREALREQATRDYLTKMWNRSAILEILNKELARSERNGRPTGVVIADLDFFKSINDTWGHDAGDEALREASRRMASSLRPYDSVGRYGGEEFLFVLPGATLDDARALSERVRKAIGDSPMRWERGPVQLSCSFGCTSGSGRDVDATELIRIADEGLYEAKRTGRDRVVARGTGLRAAVGAGLESLHDALTFALPQGG